MKKIIIIDPAKGWGHFVSKIYAYRFLSKYLDSKIVFVTKKKNQINAILIDKNFFEKEKLVDPKSGYVNSGIYIIDNIVPKTT